MDVSAWTRRSLMGCALALGLAACGRGGQDAPEPDAADADPDANETAAGGSRPAARGSIEWAVQGPWRGIDAQRDGWRHPVETLNFFGLKPGMTVVEVWPGAGWYTQILAPYLRQTNGKLYAASYQTTDDETTAAATVVSAYRKAFQSRPNLYGDIEFGTFGPSSPPLAPPGTADLVLFMQTVHAWMAAGLAEKAFQDAYAALKPGGVLGVEAHRAPGGGPQDPLAANGYVQEAYVKQLAAEAGFTFQEASEVNANPADTKNHPFGVWTLPPERRTAPAGAPADPAFDRTPYDAIGESDRMTLRFVKPGG